MKKNQSTVTGIPNRRKRIAPLTPPYAEWFKDGNDTLRISWRAGVGDDANDGFLKRDTDSGGRRAADAQDSRSGAVKAAERSVAVLYFENLSGVKEDEYLRDGVTEDIIAALSKIKGLKVLSRQAVLPF